MVSMSDLVTEGDDDLMAEFFTYDETPSPVSYQQPLQHEPLKKPNMTNQSEREATPQDSNIDDKDGQGSSKLQQKLKEVDTFVQNYSVSSLIFGFEPFFMIIFRVQVHHDLIQYRIKPIWCLWTI